MASFIDRSETHLPELTSNIGSFSTNKKAWLKPELVIISTAVESGAASGFHEGDFTAAHNVIVLPGGTRIGAAPNAYSFFFS